MEKILDLQSLSDLNQNLSNLTEIWYPIVDFIDNKQIYFNYPKLILLL